MRGETERAMLDQRLSVILDALAEAVTIRAPNNHLVYANRAALARLGMSSIAEVRDANPRALMGPFETTDEHGREVRMEDLPSVKLLRGERPEPLLLHAVHRETGDEQWSLLKATAVRDGAGEIEAAVTIIEDVTQSRRAALRMEFLARAGDVLASSLDYQQTLRNVAGLAVPQIADWCAVDLFTEDGGREPVAIAHADPEKLRTATRLRAYEPERLDPDRGLGLLRRTGESQLFKEIPEELLVAAAVDEQHLRLLREVGMRSALVVPLALGGRTIGGLTMVSSESGRIFDRGDLDFAEQIAARAALAVERARLYSERSAIARTLQSSLMPDAVPAIPGWDVAAVYRPAGEENRVGGDFYDFWEVDGDWLVLIGDVTGKGAGAAAVTSLVRHTARAASEFDPRPAQVLARIDAALRRRTSLSLCTALCLRISGEQATLAVGGHPLPVLVGEHGVTEVGEHGTLLGALARTRWPETKLELGQGETLVAFTDGVTDTVGADGERWGTKRLGETLDQTHGQAAASVQQQLVAALDRFEIGSQADDTAVVIMRLVGGSGERQDGSGGEQEQAPRMSGVGVGENG
jgi:PAS domain S-box-containing protein